MSGRKLLVLALLGITLAIVLGSWLATPVAAVDAQRAADFGTTVGGNAGFDVSPWFLEDGSQSRQQDPGPAYY